MYLLVMLISIIFNYLVSRRIYKVESRDGQDPEKGKVSHGPECKFWLILLLFYNFGMLFVFKYLNFFIENANALIGTDLLPKVALTLPLGISFYTFQMVSYVIDVYRGKYEGDDSIIYFATYVCMFPQLIAGPIVNYAEVRNRLKSRKVIFGEIELGVYFFVLGLAYKVLLADKIASLWNNVQTIGVMGINTATAWLGSWGYSMQIFFDFFGYSLMAMGLGKIMGFNLPVNFVNPYCSVSASDFWKRWHITLGRWFREYIYIPMGGSRKGVFRMILSTFVVWLFTGLWHGANWNFILWGMFFFVLLILEKLIYGRLLQKWHVLGHIYMIVCIPVSWTIFNITDLSELLLYLKRMFGVPIEGSILANADDKFIELVLQYWWLLLICVICCTPIPVKLIKKFYNNWVFKLLLLALFWFSVLQLAQQGDNPFLYFRF